MLTAEQLAELDAEAAALKSLFAEADRIGSKYQDGDFDEQAFLERNPELAALFAEADAVAAQFDATMAKAKVLAAEVRSMADSVEQGAKDFHREVLEA